MKATIKYLKTGAIQIVEDVRNITYKNNKIVLEFGACGFYSFPTFDSDIPVEIVVD